MNQPSPDIPREPTDAESEATEVEVDPVAAAADREGFRFFAIGFAIFFVIVVICASIVALVMKNMGI